MLQEVPVEQRLALLLQADHGVELGLGLARQQRPQELHRGGRHFHVDQKIRAREAEKRRQIVLVAQQRIQPDLACRCAHQRDRKREYAAEVDQPADDVGTLVAKEQRAQHVDLAVGCDSVAAGARDQPVQVAHCEARHHSGIARQIFERRGQAEIGDHADQRLAQTVTRGIVRPVGRTLTVEVVGRDGWTHEQEIVMEVVAVQHAARHGVEKRFRALRLAVICQ